MLKDPNNYISTNKSLLQINFGQRKHQKNSQRFLKEKLSNTGMDPLGPYKDFYKKDIIHPLTRTFPNKSNEINDTISNSFEKSDISKKNYFLSSNEEKIKYKSSLTDIDSAQQLKLNYANIQKKNGKRFMDMKRKIKY